MTSKPASSRRPDEELRLAGRALTDALDADLLDDVVARGRGVQGGDVRRAGEEAGDAVRVLELRREVERPLVRLPADEGRLEALNEVRSDVEPARPGPAAQPLHAAADREVDSELGHVQRNGAERLVGVEDDVGPDLVRPPDDRLDVLDAPRLEDDVRDRDEERALVDRVDDLLFVAADDDLGAALRLLEIADRGEVLLLVDDPVPFASQVEAGEDDCLGDGHVLVHDRGSRRRAHQPADLVADGERELPPALAPGADARGCPTTSHIRGRGARHPRASARASG